MGKQGQGGHAWLPGIKGGNSASQADEPCALLDPGTRRGRAEKETKGRERHVTRGWETLRSNSVETAPAAAWEQEMEGAVAKGLAAGRRKGGWDGTKAKDKSEDPSKTRWKDLPRSAPEGSMPQPQN